jgi:hypothetical protein
LTHFIVFFRSLALILGGDTVVQVTSSGTGSMDLGQSCILALSAYSNYSSKRFTALLIKSMGSYSLYESAAQDNKFSSEISISTFGSTGLGFSSNGSSTYSLTIRKVIIK